MYEFCENGIQLEDLLYLEEEQARKINAEIKLEKKDENIIIDLNTNKIIEDIVKERMNNIVEKALENEKQEDYAKVNEYRFELESNLTVFEHVYKHNEKMKELSEKYKNDLKQIDNWLIAQEAKNELNETVSNLNTYKEQNNIEQLQIIKEQIEASSKYYKENYTENEEMKKVLEDYTKYYDEIESFIAEYNKKEEQK